MKQAIPEPALRHLILKKLKNKQDGLDLLNQLEDVTYICGGYETTNKQGKRDLHAHFLVHSKYDRRITNDRKPFDNPLRMPNSETSKSTTIPQEEISKLISYTLKDADPYDYNDNQQYYIINNYTELIEEAIEKRKKHTNNGKAKTATQKLLEHFETINLTDVPKGFSQYKRIIHKECLNYARKNWKLIDANIILKMTTTVLNHNIETQNRLEKKIWEINELKL